MKFLLSRVSIRSSSLQNAFQSYKMLSKVPHGENRNSNDEKDFSARSSTAAVLNTTWEKKARKREFLFVLRRVRCCLRNPHTFSGRRKYILLMFLEIIPKDPQKIPCLGEEQSKASLLTCPASKQKSHPLPGKQRDCMPLLWFFHCRHD